jgi:hypothetical protein
MASYINSGITPNSNGGHSSGSGSSNGGTSSKQDNPVPANEPWTCTFTVNGQEVQGSGSNGRAVIGTVTVELNGPAQTVGDGVTASYGQSGVVLNEQDVYSIPQNGAADTITATVNGKPQTVIQTSDGGPVVVGAYTLTPGGDAATLTNGEVISAATDGLVVSTQHTVGTSVTTRASSVENSDASPTSDGNAASGSTGAAAELLSPHGASALVVGLFVVAVLGA